MDNVIAGKIDRCEKAYSLKRNAKTGFLLAQRYWLGYKITGRQAFLDKALDVASAASKLDFCNLPLYFSYVFLSIETGDVDTAAKLLSRVKPHRNHFKSNDPESFMIYSYLAALIELGKQKNRAATKLCELMEDYAAQSNTRFNDFLLGSLNLAFLDYAEAYKYLELAYKKGMRSCALYAALFEYYQKAAQNSRQGESLILQFINWGLAQGLDLSIILNKWQKIIISQLRYSPRTGEKIYKVYSYDWILKIICSYFISNYDVSENAFYFYKEAETKQLMFPRLNDFLVQSAYENKIENISRYSLAQYIENSTMAHEIKAFVYHLLLTDEKYSGLAEKNEDKMIMFGIYCLENAFEGRYFYSIYKFLIDMADDGRLNEPELIKTAERILGGVLFTYEINISSPKIKNLWIFEKDKRQSKAHKVAGSTVRLVMCGDDFTYQCFGENMRSMLDIKQGQVSVTRLVKNADIKLYERFFKKGMYQTELLINLAKHYMTMEIMPPLGELALEKTIADTSVSNGLKMQASAALGNCFAFQNQYQKAVQYYIGVDENCLDETNVEHMLLILIHAKKYEKAIDIIIKKPECITDRSLFFALKQIAALPEYHKMLANTAYELTLKRWYDKALIALVLKHYNGSQDEWQELSDALSAMSCPEQGLDEIILSNAIWMHKIDGGTQKIFLRMLELNRSNPLINDFALYLAYEIIINGFTPEPEVIESLEALFLYNDEHFLGYALCHYYINNNIDTLSSDKIIGRCAGFCEEDGFIFPVFKQVKDKKLLTPYIEKHTPFMYKGFSDKKADLFYRLEGDSEFKKKEMRYARFGLYFAHITHFYGEGIEYYFGEQTSGGSTLTKTGRAENNSVNLIEEPEDDYFAINNAFIYEQMFKYDKVEEIITARLAEAPRIKGWIV